MKFNIVFVISSLLFSSYCQAQTDSLSPKPSRLSIFISAGAGIPVGKFSQFEKIPQTNPELNFNMAGPAQTGFLGSAGCRYLFGRHWGMAASFYYSSFGSEKLTGEEIFDHADIPAFNWQWEAGTVSEISSWQVMGLLVGVSYEGSKGKIGYGADLKGGIQMAKSPEVSLTTTDPEFNFIANRHDMIVRDQPAMNSNAFAYHAGGFVSYQIGRKTALRLMADYTSASHQFKGEMEYVQYTDYMLVPWTFKSSTPISFKKQISFVSVMLGISLNI